MIIFSSQYLSLERHWVALDRIRSDNRTKKIDWTSSSGKAGDCMKLFDGKFIRKRCHKRYFSVCQKPKLGKCTNIIIEREQRDYKHSFLLYR